MAALLPLFPLDLVLFPGMGLPLHIFEPRYKEMIGECLAGKKPFGIVRAKENSLAEIGCTAEVLTVTKKYEDGRMDIVVEGRQRFEVVGLDQQRGFLRAEVLYFDDQPAPATAKDATRAVELHQQILDLAGAQHMPPGAPDPLLSFHLAGSLPLDLDFKQTLLGMRSERERVAAVIEYYEGILPSLRRSAHIRQKAGGNGHV